MCVTCLSPRIGRRRRPPVRPFFLCGHRRPPMFDIFVGAGVAGGHFWKCLPARPSPATHCWTYSAASGSPATAVRPIFLHGHRRRQVLGNTWLGVAGDPLFDLVAGDLFKLFFGVGVAGSLILEKGSASASPATSSSTHSPTQLSPAGDLLFALCSVDIRLAWRPALRRAAPHEPLLLLRLAPGHPCAGDLSATPQCSAMRGGPPNAGAVALLCLGEAEEEDFGGACGVAKRV